MNVMWAIVLFGGSAVDLLSHTQTLGLGPELAVPLGEWNAFLVDQKRLEFCFLGNGKEQGRM